MPAQHYYLGIVMTTKLIVQDLTLKLQTEKNIWQIGWYEQELLRLLIIIVKAHLLAIINGRKVTLEEDDPEWYEEFFNGMRHIIDSIIK